MIRYRYKADLKPTLVDTVRQVMRESGTALTVREVTELVAAKNIATYDIEDAVRVALTRMYRNGELTKEKRDDKSM